MTFSAKIKIQYDSEWTNTSSYYSRLISSSSSYQDDMLPEEHITMEIPAEDLSTIQLFKFFSNFLRAIGHNDMGIMKGACATAFNESLTVEDMRKVADEYDLKLAEDYGKEIGQLRDEIYDLKAKLSRCQQPDNPQYTDAEMDALCSQNEVTADTLKNAQVVCHDCGDKYGHYAVSCSSTWQGKCGVCGETKGVTEVRDYAYLTKGIKELSE